MKLDPRRWPAFLRDPGATRAVLLHGEDAGLARERAEALRDALVPDGDPFRLAELSREAAARPGTLSGEAAALSLTGGRRLVRVRDATDALAAPLREALDGPGEALIVLEAGELPPRSKLRLLAETDPRAAALPCYRERGEALEATLAALLRAEGVTAEPAALAWLAERSGEDRGALRREVEKLALYAGPGGRIGEEDALALAGGASGLGLDDAVTAAAAGEVAAADRAAEAAMAEGAQAVAVLRALLRHLQRLHLAALAGPQALRPPVFFRHRAAFERALRLWRPEALEEAMEALREAERAAKSGGVGRPVPEAALARQAVLAVARRAAALAQRSPGREARP